ncbi:hypothetical protein SEPCBS119000_005669 [Sporothrix epigloea]|uniref:Pentatricopeptide repeat protein n=1 Tax=Sporothrix epigloea TaxID=1892477 RepID=A0ABP0E2X0_9PEZI
MNFWSRAPRSQICSSCRRECIRRITDRRMRGDRAQGFQTKADGKRTKSVNPTVAEVPAATCMASGKSLRRARRKTGTSTVFLAGYATIIATVAAANADRKVRYREDMGRRLDEAREDLARALHDPAPLEYNLTIGLPPSSVPSSTLDGTQKAPAPTVTNTPMTTSPNKVIEAIKAICVPPAQLRTHAAQARQREAYLTWLHAQFGLKRRWWTKRPEPDAGLESLAEGMMQEELTSQETLLEGQREPRLAAQFTRLTEATNRLVDSLVEEGHRIGSLGDPAVQKASMEGLSSPWHAMKLLRSEGYPNFRLPDLDPVATTTARLEANVAAKNIFENWSQARIWGRPRPSTIDIAMRRKAVSPEVWNAKEVKFWVAKLCYNMLVSSAPPGIHNYNILMLGFISVGQHTLARIVADSLLYDTRMLPTQQTLVCLLHQARAQGDLVAFHRVLRRLAALDQNGIRIRRRAIPDIIRSRADRDWARANDVNISKGYVVQRAVVDGPITEAIITGLLSLDQVRHAAVVFAAHLDSCSKMDTRTLNSILNPVLDAVDIPAARALLRGFAQNASIITDMLMSDSRSARKLSMRIKLLLAIATAPEPALYAQPEHEIPEQFHQNAKAWMEPNFAQSELADDDRAASNDAASSQESQPWTDNPQSPRMSDEFPELMYARKLYEERKPLTKSQTRLLKKYSDRPAYHETTATTAVPQHVNPAAVLMMNGGRQGSNRRNFGTGIDQLSSAILIAEVYHYLGRLSQIVNAAHGALQADKKEFTANVDSWIREFTNLAATPHKHRYEQEQYRRMARLKAVEQTTEAVLSACSHVMESFMATVTADLAATSAAAAAAKAKAESDALQFNLGFSFMSIFQTFLRRTNVPFSLRLGTYLLAQKATQPAADGSSVGDAKSHTSAADVESSEAEKEEITDDMDALPDEPPPRSSLPFSLSPSLAQQIALLERHLTEDMPAISALLEARLKEILLQAVFPQEENSRNSLAKSMALRRRASTMSLEALLQARHLLLEHGAHLEDLPPVLSVVEGQLTEKDVPASPEQPRDAEQTQDPTETKESYGIFQMGTILS